MPPLQNRAEDSADLSPVVVGQRDHIYETVPGWPALPEAWSFGEVAAVACDADDRVYVFDRGLHPVMVFDRDGRFIHSWGETLFTRPHGITIGPDQTVWCVDDLDHTVRRYTLEGTLVMTLGTSRHPSDTGATSIDYRTITHAGPPFHYPTNLAIAPSGDLYISDGYGNARVHRFSPEGRLLASWGEVGAGPGQFHLPHGIAVDAHGTVYVADRENSRVQLFSPDGEFIAAWNELARPCDVFIDAAGDVYVAEVGYRAGMWPGTTAPYEGAPGGRVSVFSPQGELKSRWGGGERPCDPGDFLAPHDVWIDSRGDLYVSEVTVSASGGKHRAPPGAHTLQKFARRQ